MPELLPLAGPGGRPILAAGRSAPGPGESDYRPLRLPSSGAADDLWQPYDKARIEQALDEGRAVFIDYTAAWCITCQVNKKLVLNTDATKALFRRHNVLAIRADWTGHNPAITQALAQLGRNSVPVYAWYPAGESTPKLLPPLLQERMIAELFATSTGAQQ